MRVDVRGALADTVSEIFGEKKIRAALLRACARSLLGPCAHLNDVKCVIERRLRRMETLPEFVSS